MNRQDSGSDKREREAVVALAADRLDRGGADTGLGREQLVEATDPLDAGVFARLVDHRASAHDVVRDDQRAATGELQRPPEVLRIARLVGVDENQVERTGK